MDILKKGKSHQKAKSLSRIQAKDASPSSNTTKWWAIGLLAVVVAVVMVLVWDGGASEDPENAVVAKVNGEKIRADELNTQYARLPDQYRSVITKQMLLSQLVDEQLLLQESEKKKYTASADEVAAVIRQSILLTGLSEDEFYSRLGQEGITKEYLNEYYTKQIVINKLLNDTVLTKAEVSDAQVQEYYNTNKEKFNVGEQRRASHILFLVDAEQTAEEAQEKARVLRFDLTPENFAEMAQLHSQDPGSASRGGDLGEFGRGLFVPQFEDAVFSMKKGEISKPVQTQFGSHLIYLQDIIPEHQLPLEEVESSIRAQLTSEKQRVLYEEYIKSLRENAEVEIMFEEDSGIAGVSTFQSTGEQICTNADGKPLVRMFALSTCPHCQWIGDTFDKVAKEYAEAGKIEAHHYELDTGDDRLSAAVENAVPAEERALFEQYSPSRQVPLFLMGCTYKRIGNGYEMQNDLASEEAEFRAVIEELLK